MTDCQATVEWHCDESDFLSGRYSRAHTWHFDGGVQVPASSSPLIVPPPMSRTEAVDPEEAFVASLASCHMLWFLSIAAECGYAVSSYRDAAAGVMAKDRDGRIAITTVTLHPQVQFSGGSRPEPATLEAMHHAAHENCFIANSVKTDVRCEPQPLIAQE